MAAGGIYHYRLADSYRTLARYRAVLKVAPRHYGAHYQRAIALLATGNETEAIAAWRAFVALAEASGDGATLEGAPALLRRATASEQLARRPPP